MASQTQTSEKRVVKGSCHCKAITYEVALPADRKFAIKCNCTMCQKPGFINIHLDDPSGADFNLTSPADISQVKFYQYRSKDCYRYFCDRCGVQVWGRGEYVQDGALHRFFMVNMTTIDQPQEGIDVSEWTYKYLNGLRDFEGPGLKDSPYPGGAP